MHDASPSPKSTEPGHRTLRTTLVSAVKSPRRWGQVILILALLGAAVALIAMFGGWIGRQIPIFEEWIRGLGIWAPIVFVLAFVLLTTVQFPESVFAISAGVVFGLWEGFVLVMIANVIGAGIGFWVYRLILRHRVQDMLSRHPKLRAVEEAISSQGFRLLVLLRMGPFNYSVLNAILGASDVKFRAFMFALIGAFPGNFATVYFGYVARHIAQKSAGNDNLSTGHEVIAIVGFVVTVVVCLFIAHVAAHALREATDQRADEAETVMTKC